MSQILLRPLANSLPRAAFRPNVLARAMSTEPQLKTHHDWQQFKQKRAEVSGLLQFWSEYGSTQSADTTYKPRDGLRKPVKDATLSALLAAGAHFGHASTRMNPNFVPYAYGTRAGVTIIDLDSTLPMLRRAANLVRAIASANGIIVFVGTRPDLAPIVEKAAERLGQQGFYVGERWIPGTLTNKRNFFGDDILDNTRMTPDLVIFLNPLQNVNAIRECAQLHIPTVGIIDSNVDPRLVMYPIPANDENTRTAELIGGVLSIAGREGVALKRPAKDSRQVQRRA